MNDIYSKRNELCKLSMNLRSCKFDLGIDKKEISHLIKVQNEVYKKYKFYDNFIKIGGKLKCQKKDTY